MNGKAEGETELVHTGFDKHIRFFLIDDTGYLDNSVHGKRFPAILKPAEIYFAKGESKIFSGTDAIAVARPPGQLFEGKA
jgi:hypothetical protein